MPKPYAQPIREAITLYEYQRRAVESNARFNWYNWSRQVGKSFGICTRRILRGLERRRNQIFLSASERQSRELMMKAQAIIQAMQAAEATIDERFFADTSIAQLEIRMPHGVRIIGLPANPRTCRGFTGDVFLDEFAMHRDDRDIWAGIFPAITRAGGELDVASTPKGKSNKFYELAANELFNRSTVTIFDAVAGGMEANVEELRQGIGDEETWRQEYLCEFVDESTAYLTYEMISACEDDRLATTEIDWKDLEAFEGDLYAGMDIGRTRDLTVIWLLKADGERLITRGTVERRKTTFREQYLMLCRVMGLRALRRCCIDASGLGMQIAEQAVQDFGSRAEAVNFSLAVKAQLAGDLRIKVEDRSIVIPASAAIRDDWHAVVKQVTAAGNVRYLAERRPDGHSDRFWAAALAVHAGSNPVGRPEAFSAGPLTFA